MSQELIARIEAARGPDRGLDCRIWCAVERQNFDVCQQVVPNFGEWLAPSYTASIDAALTLVPDGKLFAVETYDNAGVYPVHVRASAWVQGAPRCFAATPALALCAAALKARLA